MSKLLDVLFGCTHKHLSFPLTAKPEQRHSEAASVTGTYVVCLDCGKEFTYDWQQMKVVFTPKAKPVPETVTNSLPSHTQVA